MLVTPLTSSVIFQKSLIWCDSQVVRPRSATPSSPVQIRLAPLTLFFMKSLRISGSGAFFVGKNDDFP